MDHHTVGFLISCKGTQIKKITFMLEFSGLLKNVFILNNRDTHWPGYYSHKHA